MSGPLVRRSELPESTREQMFELYRAQFENASREQFDADLEKKNWVLLLRHNDGRLVGFSNMDVYKSDVGDGEMWLVSSP